MSRWNDDLGRELRESPIPPHRPDHFERTRERIRTTPGSGGGRRRPQRPPKRLRWRTPPAASRLVRITAAAATAAAVVAAVAVSWSGIPGLGGSAPDAATADTVLTEVQQALSRLDSIRGDVIEYGTVRGRPFERNAGSFNFTSRGDYKIVHDGQDVTYTYDARGRVARRYVYHDGRILCSEMALDLPDAGPFFSPWMGASQVLDRSIAAYARAVIAELDPDVPVRPVTYEERTAWSITVPEPLVGGSADGSAHIVVDAESGYPLLVEHWSADGDVSGTRIENVFVGGDVPRGVFTLAGHVDHGLIPVSKHFRRMSLRAAARLGRQLAPDEESTGVLRGRPSARTAFTPLTTSWVPDGYRLSGVTGAVNGAFSGVDQTVAAGEVDSLTVVLTYRRGFDRFCIVSRWRHDNPPGSDDPFDENSMALTESTPVPVTYGSLRGEVAQLVLGLPDWPHLYVCTGVDDRMTVGIAGDLTRNELTRIADSLHPIPD